MILGQKPHWPYETKNDEDVKALLLKCVQFYANKAFFGES